jgi:hypothetical protein
MQNDQVAGGTARGAEKRYAKKHSPSCRRPTEKICRAESREATDRESHALAKPASTSQARSTRLRMLSG